MTTISASLVKELRDQTGAGMMDCKRALVETDGDLEAARDAAARAGHGHGGQARRPRDHRGQGARHRFRLDRGRWSPSAARPSRCRRTTSSSRSPRRSSRPSRPAAESAVEALEQERVGARRASSARTSSSSAPRASRPGTARSLAAYVHPPANKIGVLVRVRGDNPPARAAARDAHLVRGPALPDAEGRARGGRRGRARDLRATPTRCSGEARERPREDRRRDAAEALLRARACSRSSPGSTTRARRWGRRSPSDGLELLDFRRFSVAG